MFFGLVFTTKKRLAQKLQDAENVSFRAAVVDIIEILKQKDKVYLEPVTITGGDCVVRDCVFLGTELRALSLADV